jgi:hypothetical protein
MDAKDKVKFDAWFEARYIRSTGGFVDVWIRKPCEAAWEAALKTNKGDS